MRHRLQTWLLSAVICLPSCEKGRQAIGKLMEPTPASVSSGDADAVVQLDESTFESFSQAAGCIAVVDFHADWCGPCKRLGPILERIARDSGGRIRLGKIDVDRNSALARRLGVSGIPDVRIFRDGREIDRFVGLDSESSVRQRLEGHAASLPAPKADGKVPDAPSSAPAIQPGTDAALPPGMRRR